MKSIGLHIGTTYCKIVIIEKLNEKFVCLDCYPITTPGTFYNHGEIVNYFRCELKSYIDTSKYLNEKSIIVTSSDYSIQHFNNDRKIALWIEGVVKSVFYQEFKVEIKSVALGSIYAEKNLALFEIYNENDILKYVTLNSSEFKKAALIAMYGFLKNV